MASECTEIYVSKSEKMVFWLRKSGKFAKMKPHFCRENKEVSPGKYRKKSFRNFIFSKHRPTGLLIFKNLKARHFFV